MLFSHLQDKASSTVYLMGTNFQDFSQIDWIKLGIDMDSSLVFFDDHQSGLKRTMQAWDAGEIIRRAMQVRGRGVLLLKSEKVE